MSYKVAVIGATGNVGREMLGVLSERAFPVSEVVALASTRSIGTEVSFGNGTLKVKALDYYDFKGTDIVLMSAGSDVAKQWAPKIAASLPPLPGNVYRSVYLQQSGFRFEYAVHATSAPTRVERRLPMGEGFK